jgi:hypothetical protein
MEKYVNPLCLGIQSKRGCVLNCSYCTYPYLNGNNVRLRSPGEAADEIEMLINKYNVKEIIFADDIFNIPYSHAVEIINEIKARKIKIMWSAWFDVVLTDKKLIDMAKDTGCYRFCFSVDGIVNKTLNSLQKNFNEARVWELLKICRSPEYASLDFRFSIFALPPEQTIMGIIKTIIYVFITHVVMKNGKCLVSWIRILPNTDLLRKYAGNIESKAEYLLPLDTDNKNKDKLFYMDSKINKFILKIYFFLLEKMNKLRKIRKSIINYG